MNTQQLQEERSPLHLDEDGAIRIAKTRVTLDSIIAAHRDGAAPEEIVHQYPVLSLGDVYAAIAFVLRCPTQVESYLAARQQQRQANQSQYADMQVPEGTRELLLSRRR